jgi:AcrR family transcriptional regulator
MTGRAPTSRPRGIGRPPKTSREAIVEGVIALLARNADPAVSMQQIAGEIGVSPMALYNYFENRDELMQAVTERLMADFRVELGAGAGWREDVTAWAHAVHAHFRRHPYLLNFLTWGEHYSIAWLSVSALIPAALARAGLAGPALARASSWVTGSIMGAVYFELWSARSQPLGEDDLARIPEPHRSHTATLRAYAAEPDFLDQAFRFNLERTLDALELYVAAPR